MANSQFDPKDMHNNLMRYIRNSSEKPIKRKIKVSKYGVLWHMTFKDMHLNQVPLEKYQAKILDLYMKKIINIQLEKDSDILLGYGVKFYSSPFVTMIRRILRKNDWHPIVVRFESPNTSFWIVIECMSNRNEVGVSYFLCDEKQKIVKIGTIEGSLTNMKIGDITNGPFIFADNRKDAERILREIETSNGNLYKFDTDNTYIFDEKYPYIMDYQIMVHIDTILHKYEDKISSNEDLWNPVYRDTEISLFRGICSTITRSSLMKVNDIHTWINPDKECNMYEKLSHTDLPIIMMNNRADEAIPLLDLTDRELNYIIEYCKKLGLSTKYEPSTRSVDLVKYLYSPRYGKTFRYEVQDTNMDIHTIVCTYTLYLEEEYLRFHMVTYPTHDISIYSIIDFDNIRHFNMEDSLSIMTCSILQRDPTKLLATYDDIDKYVPEFMTTFEGIIDILIDILYTHIVIYERPQRMRMIKYVPRFPSPEAEKRREEPTFVVRRILKPLKEAKLLVKRSKEDQEKSDAIYTMEKWERIGHWRRLPNSEEKIWIDPTTCHRHLPLIECDEEGTLISPIKEIHIKL